MELSATATLIGRVGVVVVGASVAVWGIAHLLSRRRSRWRPGMGVTLMRGPLGIRTFGAGNGVVVLLPGIAATGTFYGAAFDRLGDDATVLVIDPRGFGRSMDEHDREASFGLADHRDAILDVLSAPEFAFRPVTLVGHSMGASLAVSVAAAASSEGSEVMVEGVIMFDAPLFVSECEARQRITGMGWFEALLATGRLARSVCAWMCRHRLLASYVAVAINPSLPVPVARDGVQHTWASYTGALHSVVMSPDWAPAFHALSRRDIPVLLVNGVDDRVPVPGRAERLADEYPNVTVLRHRGGHDLPLSDPLWCAEVIARAQHRTRRPRAVTPGRLGAQPHRTVR